MTTRPADQRPDGPLESVESAPVPPADFETSLAELNRIVQQLEGGSLGLEESLSRFEQGIGLLRRCYETLEKAEQRIELLTGFDADGNPVTSEFPAPADVEVSVEVREEVRQTQIEVTRERRPAPRQASVEKRIAPEEERPESEERRLTLF